MINSGDKFKHMHVAGMTCEIVEPTNKGFKVLQSEVRGRKTSKPVTKFYEREYFIGGWKQWEKIS